MGQNVRIVHLRKRVDRHFKFRSPVKPRTQRWGILLAILLIILFIWLSKRSPSPVDALAVVNGQPITLADLAEQRQQMAPEYRNAPQTQLLDQAINELLLIQEAEQHGIIVSPEEIDALISQTLQERGATMGDLNRVLQERQLTLAQFREAYRKQLTISKLVEQLVPVSVPEDAIAQFYEQYPTAFADRDPAETQAEIRQLLERQQRQMALPELVAGLRNRSSIRIVDAPQR